MELKINSHVSRLNRYLPFSASHDQIYEEYQSDEDGLNLETKALSYTIEAVRTKASCIVLTGDAGHGKTHLCRRLLVDYLEYDQPTSRTLLRNSCDGEHLISHPISPKTHQSLRIHKDFSEIDPKVAAEFIEKHVASGDSTLVICANEGRLRAIISSAGAGAVCASIQRTFQHSFKSGLASADGSIHIINLNFQSVAAEKDHESGSLLKRTVKDWAGNGSRWSKSCSNCSVATHCPIKKNRDLLGNDQEKSANRLDKLERLFSTVERLGYVITIREMLMLCAYIVTGGLTCKDVQKKLHRGSDSGWQHQYAYYNLLFIRPDSVPSDRLAKGIPILAAFAPLDPGNTAERTTDDRLLNQGSVFPEGEIDLQFGMRIGGSPKTIDGSFGIDDVIGSPQSRADLERESSIVRQVVSALRRRAFFDDVNTPGAMLKRLGFRHGDDFLALLEEKLSPKQKVQLKNLVVAGLHGVQGLRMTSTATNMLLVDPAFGQATSHAAIIAHRIPTQDIQIMSSSSAWNKSDSLSALEHSVDWIDRKVVVVINDTQAKRHHELPLDLLGFECIARSAAGYLSEEFFAQEMTRVRAFLGKIAELGQSPDGQIALFIDGRIQTISLDEDVIQVSGGSN
jgi:hypothetical protein